ncbi:MAG: DUF433 domain-containing protein [Nitrospira sp.]|nr:DUF433 domain-containing protein [Nitrospira sp.]
MDWKNRITLDPEKRGGKPCIRGLRMIVYDVLEYLASGMSEEDILKDFPDLTREDIRACLAFAADRERKLVSIPPSWSCSSIRISPIVSFNPCRRNILTFGTFAKSGCRSRQMQLSGNMPHSRALPS